MFREADPNKNCPDDQVVDTASQCIKALAQLGLPYGSIQYGTSKRNYKKPAGCYRHTNILNGGFNFYTNPADTAPNFFKISGICHHCLLYTSDAADE